MVLCCHTPGRFWGEEARISRVADEGKVVLEFDSRKALGQEVRFLLRCVDSGRDNNPSTRALIDSLVLYVNVLRPARWAVGLNHAYGPRIVNVQAGRLERVVGDEERGRLRVKLLLHSAASMRIHWTCLLAVAAAQYSASADNSLTVACIFDGQCSRSPAYWMAVPVRLQRMSVQPAQSESTKASNRADGCDASLV